MVPLRDSRYAFHRGTAPLFALLTPDQTRQLANLAGDPDLNSRIELLAEKANEGELSDEERMEYDAYIEANNLLAVLQAEARFFLTDGILIDGCQCTNSGS